jgi:hypothetical protein
MGKKENTACELAENLRAVTALIPQLEKFVKIHKEIAAGYQKYRKNGGEAISGIEKYAGIKTEAAAVSKKAKRQEAPVAEVNAPKKTVESKKAKNKGKA